MKAMVFEGPQRCVWRPYQPPSNGRPSGGRAAYPAGPGRYGDCGEAALRSCVEAAAERRLSHPWHTAAAALDVRLALGDLWSATLGDE